MNKICKMPYYIFNELILDEMIEKHNIEAINIDKIEDEISS